MHLGQLVGPVFIGSDGAVHKLAQLFIPSMRHDVGDEWIMQNRICRPIVHILGQVLDSHYDIDGNECLHLLRVCCVPTSVRSHVRIDFSPSDSCSGGSLSGSVFIGRGSKMVKKVITEDLAKEADWRSVCR